MASSSMIARALAVALVLLGAIVHAPAQARRDIVILYLDREDDAHYRLQPGYTGALRRVDASPFPAAELAVKDSEAAMRAAGLRLRLVRHSLKAEERGEAVLAAQADIDAAILDLPRAETEAAAKALAGRALPLFNARHRDVELRIAACRTALLSTLPSLAMLSDALAQVLAQSNWKRVLLLEGPLPADQAYAASFARAAQKFGLRLVERRQFVPGNDPRRRDQSNIRLLTGGADYDVIVVADEPGQFARTVPYQTALPRPVAGATGLVASAWHPYWERHGAPQLNRRFHRLTSRPMSDEDWATWVAIRALADAAILPGEAPLAERLLDPRLKIETYKGVPGSFRPWSRELRQAILVATHDTVVSLAPVDGALHRTNVLDTLGADEPEFRCPA